MSSSTNPSQAADPSSNFKSMLDAALAEYKKKTGEDLQAIWLASELQTCGSVDSVLDILRDQAQAFERSGDQKLMKWIDPLINVLFIFSDALGDGVSLAFPPAKVIFTGIGVLLGAAKDARASHGAIIDLFERIESFFKRLEVYTQISLTTKMAEVLVKIVIELLSILSIATKEVRRRRAKLFARKLLGRTDIEDALKRLDRLIQEEFQMAIAQVLKATTEVKDGADKANIAMQQIMSDVVEVKHDVGEVKCDVVEVKRDVGEVKCDVEEVKWAQIGQDIHKWFSPPDPSTNYNTACEVQSEGSTTWFLQGTKFKDWMSIGSFLWIHGKPGSGKSILCSSVIKHVISLRDAGKASLAFFYFDFRDEEKKQDPRNFVKSLLVQLSAYSIPCCKIISHIYSTHGKGTQQPSNEVLKTCLREMLSVAAEKPIYLIVDALDECPDSSGIPTPREVVLNLLEGLLRLGLLNLRICVTSRPEVDIKHVLGPLAARVVSLHDESGQMKDISDYVSKVVYSDNKMGRWRSDQRELVVEELSKKADGMFRWVFCQLEVLRHCLPASIRQTLDQLPKSLDDTYLRVLRQIPQANQTHAHRMLQCLVVAVRPLRVEELAELLAFEFDAAQGGIPKYRPALRLEDQTQAVLLTCSSLVTIIDNYGRPFVQFSHFSVKEFLVSNRLASSFGDISRYHIRLGSSHTILTQACLGLLINSDKESVESSSLADYAAVHWVEHAQFEDVASRVKDGMETLFDPEKPHFATWIRICDIDWGLSRGSEKGNPLYYSVLCGFYGLAEHLVIKHPYHVNAFGGKYKFPLLAAITKGHVGVAELLLKHGADVDVRDEKGSTMLLMVLEMLEDNLLDNLLVAMEFLLKHGAEVNRQDDDNQTPLFLAMERGCFRTVQILLEHGAEVDTRFEDNNTRLHLAIRWNQFKLAGILLEHGADANAETVNGITPLHILSLRKLKDECNIFNFALLLLKHGAEVNSRDEDNDTPLHLAILRNKFELATILLEHGADSDAENNSGITPLHILSESESKDEKDILDLALLLLKNGAEANYCRTEDNATPLHIAIHRNRFQLARILLERGADASAEAVQRITPLHVLLVSENKDECDILDLALLLLKHGAEVNCCRTEDNATPSPLHLAICKNRLKLAGILLERGADATAETVDRITPLQILLESKSKDEFDILNLALRLLKHGAEVNCCRTEDNATPLHLAIYQNRFKLAGILLERGADANAETVDRLTPFHILSKSKSKDEKDILDLALLLLKYGAEVNCCRTEDNATPLHLAIHRNQFKLAGILLERCADANAETVDRLTPLHILSKSKSKDGKDILNLALLLLKHGAEVNCCRTEDNATPLHLAIYRNRFKLAGILLEHGADANAETVNGETPLFILSKSRDCDESHFVYTSRLLLDHSVEVNRKDTGKNTSLLLGIDDIMGNNVGKLSESVQPHSRGHHSFRERGLVVAQRPFQCAVDFSAPDENQTWYQTATAFSQPNLGPSQIATLLLNYGADPNSVKKWAEGPLYRDIEYVNVQIKNHLTPLHLASFYGWVEMARVLINRGATANSEDKLGRTPLHLVVKGSGDLRHDGSGITRILLEHGSDVNAQDKHKTTPLHLASHYGNVGIARILLGCGANLNAKDSQGQTPLHMVSQSAYFSKKTVVDATQLLLDNGADVNAQDSNGATPLDLALHHGKLILASLLHYHDGDEADAKIDQSPTPHQLESEAAHLHDRPMPNT